MLRVVIPGYIPTSMNVLMRMHWAERNRVVGSEKELISTYVVMAYNGSPEEFTLESRKKVRVMFEFGKGRRGAMPDPDNLNKIVRDALTACKMIQDDRPEFAVFEEPTCVRGEETRTVIELEEISPDPKPATSQMRGRKGKK